MNDISKLYDVLFNTLQGLQDKNNPMDIERARAINETGQVLVNAAKTEIDFLKATGKNAATFFPEPRLESVTDGVLPYGHGVKTVQALPGGTVSTHRMR